MSVECSCERHGYCARRGHHLTAIHWQRCQAGDVERLDAIYAEIDHRRESRGRQVQSPEVLRPTAVAQAVPLEQWPKWASILGRYRKPGESGVGDTAQRITAQFGGEWWKWLSAKLGIPCGCASRQRRWNTSYRY